MTDNGQPPTTIVHKNFISSTKKSWYWSLIHLQMNLTWLFERVIGCWINSDFIFFVEVSLTYPCTQSVLILTQAIPIVTCNKNWDIMREKQCQKILLYSQRCHIIWLSHYILWPFPYSVPAHKLYIQKYWTINTSAHGKRLQSYILTGGSIQGEVTFCE